jgi:hypothetical protein
MMQNQRSILWRAVSTCALVGLLSLAAQEAPRFVGRIVDSQMGQPLAASVVLKNANGEAIEIVGEHAHVQYLRRRWCYVDGQFELPGNVGGLTVEIRRGLETLPILKTVDSGAAGQTFRLERWINMADRGYMSGDSHVHLLSPAQCHLQMRAEDLAALNLLVSDFTNDVDNFTGRLDRVSTPGHAVYIGQEFRDWQHGHINLLRLRKLIEPLQPFGGAFQKSANPNLHLAPAAREARAQGAVVNWAHFGNLPGAESPIDIALGLIDAIELITHDDPTGLPTHWEPWRMERPANLPALTALSGLDLYYHYLNAGFRLPMVAGTDKMSEVIPVGSSRFYARVGKEQSFDAWIAGLKAGNGFITNGPMLTFEADGRESGEVVEFYEPRTVTARATAESMHPFTRLQIIVNGEAVATSATPARDAAGIYETKLEARIKLDRSAWVAARVTEPSREGKLILPRNLTVFAHANPVYFLRGGAKVRVQESIGHLLLYLRYSEHWLRTAAKFGNGPQRQEAVQAVEQALDFYKSL